MNGHTHTFTVRDRFSGRVMDIQIDASTREAAARWIDLNPNLTIVARIPRARR